MIERNTNVYMHRLAGRMVELSGDHTRVTLHDSRYYQRTPGVFYPSVTTILSYFPKDKFFETWLKDVGHNADIIVSKAADDGTQVHKAIENYLEGKELRWINQDGHVNYRTDIWKMILKFVEFWETYKPTLIASEEFVFSDEYKYAGTLDLIVEIGGVTHMLDIKTSNMLHESYFLQLAAYHKAWQEQKKQVIDKTGVLWLKSAKRGPDKKAKVMQGKGWEVKESDRSIEDNFKMFQNIYDIYRLTNPEEEIELLTLPNTVKMP